jgi:hypothetical protein
MSKDRKTDWTIYDLCYALDNAAEFLELEEWPDPKDKTRQEAANREGARRIRRMSKRLEKRIP